MYSSMALWPQQVQGMFFTDPEKIGLTAMTTGAGFYFVKFHERCPDKLIDFQSEASSGEF